MKYKLKIEIIGNKASIFLLDKKRNISSELTWTDKRDLSKKLLPKIDFLLKKNNLSIKNIEKSYFECDSPYFKNRARNTSLEGGLFSKNKCGFTAWQTGEITAKVLDFCC